MGGDLYLDPEDPSGFAEGTDLVSGIERLAHVEELLPDICTLDCGSLNFGEGSLVYVSTPDMLRDGAKRIQELGVRPRAGDLRHRPSVVRQEAARRGADRRARRCTSCAWASRTARPAEPALLAAMVAQLPPGAVWASFAIGPHADAVGGAVGAARRARAGRPGGQPLPRPRAIKVDQRATGGERGHDHHERWAPRSPRPTRRGRSSACRPRRAEPRRRRLHAWPRPGAHRVACVGAGVIGGGWVAYFLARGYGCTPGTRPRTPRPGCARLVDAAWPALTELGLAEGATTDRLTVAPTLADGRRRGASSCRRARPSSWTSSAGCWPTSTRPRPRACRHRAHPPPATG